MALFGTPNAYLGLDIGTSSLKLVELVRRRRTIEVATYAEANLPNILVHPPGSDEDAARRVANVITQMVEKSGVVADAVVAALPNGIVFSTVLKLPDLPDKQLDEAVHFAARDVVPASLDEMFLGWSRVGELPHMDSADQEAESATVAATKEESLKPDKRRQDSTIPIFITAAPRDVVGRYTRLMELTGLELVALEVETFPLVRSLLANENDSAMIVDIGDQATTFHLIDSGTPRLSHTIDYGGRDITVAIAEKLNVSAEEAHNLKVKYGMTDKAPERASEAIKTATAKLFTQAQRLLDLHRSEYGRHLPRTVLIGGGAKLQGLANTWQQTLNHKTQVGNPWRGLAYPQELDQQMKELGPTYGVAVGLAQRGMRNV